MKKIFLPILLILLSVNAEAQRPGGGGSGYGNYSVSKGIIKGKVKGEHGELVEYATISLFSKQDSSLVTGSISKEDGSFEISDLSFGRYYAEVSFVGFDETIINDINIRPPNFVVDLKDIVILPSAESIGEVEVIANKPHVEYKIDKKVVSVSQDISAAGGTAVDVLENVPSIETDIEGNVSLRGSGNFTVYIDGRPSILGSEALQQLPASAIENIEIITNPSAKYDAEGTAGIINVVMKKRRGQGINGIINTSIGTKGKYRADILLNLRSDNFNIYGGLDYNNRKYSMEANLFEQEWETGALDTLYTINEREINNKRGGYGFKLGFDYFLNDRNTLTLSGEYDIRERDRSSKSRRNEVFRDTITDFYTNSFSYFNGNNYELNVDYVSKFNENGHELSARLNYEGETGGRDEGLEEYILSDNNRYIINDYKIVDDNPEYELRLKTDYVYPFSESGKFEAGLQYDADFSHYDFKFQEKVEDIGYRDVDSLNQILDIDRAIYSAYSMFSNSLFWQIEYQLGLRFEYTDREVRADKNYPVKRPDLFPSVHMSKKINDKNQLMANYTRRINRPREWALNPVTRFWDTETIRQGNPDLKPEYTNSYEVNYQYSIDRSFLAFELYHRHTTDVRERYIVRLDDGTKLMTDQNVGKSFATGMEIMSNVLIKEFLVLNASYSLYNFRLDSENRNEYVDNEDFAWRGRLNATFNLPWKGRLQINGFYRSSSITSQGERDGFFVTNFGYRQELFDRKLSVAVQGRDIFSSMNFSGISYYENSIIESEFTRESPIIRLTLSYRINNYKTRDTNRQNGENNGGSIGGDDMF